MLCKTTWFGVPALQSLTDFWVYQETLRRTDMYECDRERESFVITWNPKGYVKRVS